MKPKNKTKAIIAAYARSALAAVLAVAMTGNTNPDDLAKAAFVALLPPLLRWANSSDPAFGRGSK